MTRPPPAAPTGDELRRLLESARQVRTHAHAPYSGFRVGAALLLDSGEIVAGCNVENASFPLSVCAERVAIGTAIARGLRGFRAIAVVGPDDEQPCYPCGGCRQVLHEFAPDLLVVTPAGPGNPPHVAPLADLLPHAFGPDGRPASSPP